MFTEFISIFVNSTVYILTTVTRINECSVVTDSCVLMEASLTTECVSVVNDNSG
jgi:hypothetical protein